MDQQKIGAFLKRLRKEKGFTQEQLAERFHVSDRTVSRWENGNNLPDLSVLVELADFYEVEIREIIDGERKSGEMNAETKQTVQVVADYAKEEKKHIRRRTKIISVVVTLAAAAALLFLGHVLNDMYGNPVSAALAKRNAQQYIDINFNKIDLTLLDKREYRSIPKEYQINKVHYWKDEKQYIVEAIKKDSPDSTISMTYGMHGDYYNDNADAVLNGKQNTLHRMTEEYMTLVKDAFKGTKYEYDKKKQLVGGFIQIEESEYSSVPAVDPATIRLDQIFDYNKIGKTHGKVSVIFTDTTAAATPENAAVALLDIRKILDDAGVAFAVVSLSLNEHGETGAPHSLMINEFSYDEIDADGLVERVKAAAVEE